MVSKQDVLNEIPKDAQIENVSDTDVICHGGFTSPGYRVSVNDSKWFKCQGIGIFDDNGIWILDLHDLYGVKGLDDISNSLRLDMDSIQKINIQRDI